jgi:mediator of RNA polymerase II transcription subunit 18, fungi type
LNNTILFLYRILLYPTANSDSSLRTSLPSFGELKPLDPSGAYILEAKLRLSDGSNASLVSVGQQELERFQHRMKGVVELKVPDRLALDTRVK